MKITVDEEGHITPPNSATFVTMKPEAQKLVDGKDITDSAIAIYQCDACTKVFEAQRGQVKIHECEPPKQRRRYSGGVV